jgi:hypothetical protein
MLPCIREGLGISYKIFSRREANRNKKQWGQQNTKKQENEAL